MRQLIWAFLYFWGRCSKEGVAFAWETFGFFDCACALIGTVFYCLKKRHRRNWEEKWEPVVRKFIVVIIAATLLVSIFGVAPFLQYREALKDASQTEAASPLQQRKAELKILANVLADEIDEEITIWPTNLLSGMEMAQPYYYFVNRFRTRIQKVSEEFDELGQHSYELDQLQFQFNGTIFPPYPTFQPKDLRRLGVIIRYMASGAPLPSQPPQLPQPVASSSVERIFLMDSVEQVMDTLRDKTTHERDMLLRDKYLGKWVKGSFSFQDLNTEGGVVRVVLYVEGKRGLEMLNYPPITAIMEPSMLPKLTHRKIGESLLIQGQIRYFGELEFDLVNAEVLN